MARSSFSACSASSTVGADVDGAAPATPANGKGRSPDAVAADDDEEEAEDEDEADEEGAEGTREGDGVGEEEDAGLGEVDTGLIDPAIGGTGDPERGGPARAWDCCWRAMPRVWTSASSGRRSDLG